MTSEPPSKEGWNHQELAKKSRSGLLGQVIPVHRSLEHFEFPRAKLKAVVLLPIGFSLIAWPAIWLLGRCWAPFFQFWVQKLSLPATVVTENIGPTQATVTLPLIHLPSVLPSPETWLIVAAVTLVALLITFTLPDQAFPIRYLVRVLAFIQTTALLFFWFLPDDFPHTASGHLEHLVLSGVVTMLIVPWLHALVYYIFAFSILKQIALTLLTLLLLAVLIPFLVIGHAYALHHGSMLLLPVLYFAFGLFAYVMVCIALYGWGMSWNRVGENSPSKDEARR